MVLLVWAGLMRPPEKIYHTDGGFVGCDDSAHREEQCGALDLHEAQHRLHRKV